MLFLVLFTMAVLFAVALARWPALGGPKLTNSAASPPAGDPPTRATTLEGALTAQLVRGEINRAQYQRALERLAAREAEKHPLSAPEKGDPSAGA
ncbi:hypothetical protein GCM10010168_77640 [Actinoplanes ianthinogenes]|uniref:SHOCT domain-containing protein n=2 Tax=Actinoplanes ianthinogenes TaxID=122358 RepID=A0ABN6CST1_9ACTN|nr:hypothetical protein Aiant_89670 [Actinoplanes ianthinogenes]GGR47239.1 hypothetical protein GCM10010168_77640 [Actinoplanes ianthinogenes]